MAMRRGRGELPVARMVPPERGKLPPEWAVRVGEIKRRLDEIDSGAVEMIPAEQVHARMIARLSPEARARMRE